MRLAGQTVIHFADYGGPYAGNFIASLLALERELEKHGARQVWVFGGAASGRRWLRDLADRGRSLYVLDMGGSVWTLTREVYRIAVTESGAILHSHFTTFDVPVWIATRSLRLRRRVVQCVWHVHLPSATPTQRRRLRDVVKLSIMGRFAHSVVVSHGGLETLLERGAPRDRVTVIENGIDLERATRRSEDRDTVRRRLGIDPGAAVVLMFGWDPIRKGVDIALQALSRIVRRRREVVLMLVGQGRLQEFLAQQELSSLGAHVRIAEPRETVADYFFAADVFLSASRAEGFSYAVAEALANGMLVVSSQIRGLEWAASAPGVRMFPSGDAEALATCIESLLNLGPTEKAQLAMANREFAQCYDVGQWARQVVEFYAGL